MNKIDSIERNYESFIHLSANENIMSELAWRYHISSLSNRYRHGHNGEEFVSNGGFATKGLPEVGFYLLAAQNVVKKMLHAELVNLDLLSGAHAMQSALICCTEPGDTVMTVNSKHGGHFCTNGILEMTGRKHIDTSYDFDLLTFDVEAMANDILNNNVSAVYLDTSVMLKPHPIKKLRELIGNSITIIYDASHTIGLILSGEFQSPFDEGADVITANTHKTLPGPHHGMIAFRDYSFGMRVNKKIQSSMYSTVHTNEVLALCVAIFEIYRWGSEYSAAIIKNANLLGAALEERGARVRKISETEYTKNHQLHIYTECDVTHNLDIIKRLTECNILSSTSRALGNNELFVRLGLQEITRRGLSEKDIPQLADLLYRCLFTKENIYAEVQTFSDSLQECRYGYYSHQEIEYINEVKKYVKE